MFGADVNVIHIARTKWCVPFWVLNFLWNLQQIVRSKLLMCPKTI